MQHADNTSSPRSPHERTGRPRIAVIGAGAAGLAAVWELGDAFEVHLFERQARPGGHVRTVQVPGAAPDGGDLAADTAFMICHPDKYPEFFRMLEEFALPTNPAPMDITTTCEECGWCMSPAHPVASSVGGGVLGKVRFVREALRFTRHVQRVASSPEGARITIGEYLAEHGFSERFAAHFVTPMISSVWTNSRADVMGFPLQWIIGFMADHRMFDVNMDGWRTVIGGAQGYVDGILRGFAGELHLGCEVVEVRRPAAGGAKVVVAGGEALDFDEVVLCSHADQTLALLGDADPVEREVLGGFSYAPSTAWVHGDVRALPKQPRMRSSWNHHLAACDLDEPFGGMTYWLDRIQQLETRDGHPIIVTLDPGFELDERLVHTTIDFEHPRYSRAALAAQERMGEIDGVRSTWFAGGWRRHGFHEDAFSSGVAAARALRERYAQAGAGAGAAIPAGSA